MRVLILGCGIYGCHAAMTLKSQNITFKMADINNNFFTGSSSKNQNRLHLGFHYPRSYYTRTECKNGFKQFIDYYSHVLEDIPDNYYFIEKKSLIDLQTYRNIYKYEEIAYKDTCIDQIKLPFKYNDYKFQGAIKTDEKYINFNKLSDYFRSNLEEYLIPDFKFENLSYETKPIKYNDLEFDLILDCTYLQAKFKNFPQKPDDIFYELCVSFLYKQVNPSPLFGFTVMDGEFFSLFPYDSKNNIYSLTDVKRTPLAKCWCFEKAQYNKENFIKQQFLIDEVRSEFEQNVNQYIPNFTNDFIFVDYYLSFKTKKKLNTDDRSLIYECSNNIHRFAGGKLTGIFTMEKIIKSIISD